MPNAKSGKEKVTDGRNMVPQVRKPNPPLENEKFRFTRVAVADIMARLG